MLRGCSVVHKLGPYMLECRVLVGCWKVATMCGAYIFTYLEVELIVVDHIMCGALGIYLDHSYYGDNSGASLGIIEYSAPTDRDI